MVSSYACALYGEQIAISHAAQSCKKSCVTTH
jgi:hypothetical protein